MVSLHSATDLTKQILKWIGIVIGGFIVLILLFRAGRAIKNTFFPTPPPAPTMAFGKLPAIQFPQSPVNKSFTYDQTLGTLTGKLPSFPNRILVFKTLGSTASLLNIRDARQKIQSIGFSSNDQFSIPEVSLGNSIYQWTDNTPIARQIVMNTVTYDFSMTSSYLQSPDVLNAIGAPPEDVSKQIAQGFLNNMQLFPTDVDPNKTQTQYLKVNDSSLVQATNQNDGQITSVDLFQQDIDESPVLNQKLAMYYPAPGHSLINFIVAPQGNDEVVVVANFFHQAFDLSSSATYPLKTAEEAFSDLQKGNAYVGAYQGTSSEIQIQNVKLGYYIGKEKVPYLMPIIVFEGNNGFSAYVSAIPDIELTKN